MDVADRIAKLERALQVVATDPARARVDLEMERARKKAAGEEEEEEDAAAARPFSRSRRRPPLRRPWLPRRIRRCAGRPRTSVLPVPGGAAAERPPRPAHHEGNEEQLPNHNSFANPSHHLSLFMQASGLAVRTGKLHLLASTLRPVSTSAAANSNFEEADDAPRSRCRRGGSWTAANPHSWSQTKFAGLRMLAI